MGPTCCWWRFPIATKHSHFSGLAVGRPHSIWIAQSSPSPRRISPGSWRTWWQWASPCYQSKHGISDFFYHNSWFAGFDSDLYMSRFYCLIDWILITIVSEIGTWFHLHTIYLNACEVNLHQGCCAQVWLRGAKFEGWFVDVSTLKLDDVPK